jgi:hypothetical protein
MPGLTIHKHKDGSVHLRGYHPSDPPPSEVRVSTKVVEGGISEGWLSAEGSRTVVRPGGPPEDKDRPDVSHIFRQADVLVFHTRAGDIRYKVVHNPDKYADHDDRTFEVKRFKADDDTPVTDEIYAAGATRVDHFYDLVRED